MKIRFSTGAIRLSLLAALFFVLTGNQQFWSQIFAFFSPLNGQNLWVLVSLFSVTLSLMFFLLSLIALPYLFRPLLTLILLGNAAAAYFMNSYGILIDRDMLQNVFETNPAEAFELINLKLIGYLLLLGVLPSLLLWRTHIRYGKWQPALARRTLEGVRGQNPRVESLRHLLLACLHLHSSRRMAQGHLRKAASIAAANGIGQLLSPPMEDVLEFARDTAREYQDDDLLWLLKSRPADDVEPRVRELDTSLSRGELQLLAFLPTRARNADIADSLGISVNTVKTRLRRLYAKLHAGNRDDALARARERGLLES